MPITQEQLAAHDPDREVGRPHLNTPNANNVPGGASIGEVILLTRFGQSKRETLEQGRL